MLILFNQFLLKEAIRTPVYLLNPTIVRQDEIKLPRFSVLHYLDNTTDSHFPNRNLVYFSDIPNNKKIPIHHVLDLVQKDEVGTLLNKTYAQEVRKWSRNNIKEFRTIDLLEQPNKDINLISVYNYNLLKDLYKYKTSLLSNYAKYNNLYSTYWHYVKEAISKDTDSYHFVKIDLPNTIPSFNIINIIIKFNAVKYSRVVSDVKLAQIIDLYKWLLNSTRESSTLKKISDEDSKRIVIEISYKGYSAFLPLYIIRSMAKESSLENKIKITDDKIQKLFIVTLYKLQNKINAILESLEEPADVLEEHTPEEQSEEIKKEDYDDDNEESVNAETDKDSDILDSFPEPSSFQNSADIKDIDNKKKLNDLINTDKDIYLKINESIENNILTLNKILENELETTDTKEADRLFEETILQLEEEQEDSEKPILTVNKDPAHIESVLKDKTLDDKFNIYIKEVSEFKLLTSQELRNIKKTFENRSNLKSPYNSKINIDVDKQIDPESIKFTAKDAELNIDNDLIPDNLKKEVILNLDKKYINKVLKKDIISCVTNIEKAGIIIKEYSVENENTAMGNYEIHKLLLKPLDGKESTVYFRLPKIDSEGEFVTSGVRLRMRKQRTD